MAGYEDESVEIVHPNLIVIMMKFRGVSAAGKVETSTFAVLDKYMKYGGIFFSQAVKIYNTVSGERTGYVLSRVSVSAEKISYRGTELGWSKPLRGSDVHHYTAGATVVLEYMGKSEYLRGFVLSLRQLIIDGQTSGHGFWARVKEFSILLAKDIDVVLD